MEENSKTITVKALLRAIISLVVLGLLLFVAVALAAMAVGAGIKLGLQVAN